MKELTLRGLDRDWEDHEFNLGELFRRLFARWPIIACSSAAGLVFGILALHLANYTFTAELKITPVQVATQGSALMKQLGGLASLTGLSSLNPQTSTPFFLYVESATSRSVADELATHQDLMQVIFASEWDRQTSRFVQRKSRIGDLSDTLKGAIGLPVFPWTPPDGARLQLYLRDNIRVIEDRAKPLVTITYNHKNPDFAVTLLSLLNQTIDNQIRKRTLARVDQNISYLSHELATMSVVELRQAIIETVSEQEKSKMMMNSSAPVAAEILSGPSASFRPTRPLPLPFLLTWWLAGTFIGAMIGLAIEGLQLRAPRPREPIAGREGVN